MMLYSLCAKTKYRQIDEKTTPDQDKDKKMQDY